MKQKKRFVLDKAGFFYRMNTQVTGCQSVDTDMVY
jgi:hypothetical protein